MNIELIKARAARDGIAAAAVGRLCEAHNQIELAKGIRFIGPGNRDAAQKCINLARIALKDVELLGCELDAMDATIPR